MDEFIDRQHKLDGGRRDDNYNCLLVCSTQNISLRQL
nr:MAG TPA: hypothetical protein [Caudoviricetes sp.]